MTLVDAETGEVVRGELMLPEDAAVLDAVSDPGAFVVAALDRAKAWLAQATTTDLPEVVEAKARAEAIRCYTAQKELGHDAELNATEIVRRAERRIGQLIREGQAAGELRKRHQSHGRGVPLTSPDDIVTRPKQFYPLSDEVSEEQFEEAISEAKEDRDLSRANVVRKVQGKKGGTVAADDPKRLAKIRDLAAKGHDSRQIGAEVGLTDITVRSYARRHGIEIHADAVMRKQRRHDMNRIVDQLVIGADALTAGLDLIDYEALDRSQLATWADSLSASIKSLTTVKNKLNKELAQ